jgi:23S rRNA (uracil1939-C5)-methyltransferase
VNNNRKFRSGQLVSLEIASMAPSGEAVAKDDGFPVFVERACVGEDVEIEIYDSRAHFARGHLRQVLRPSQQRTEPPCKLFKVCGGCQWQHMTYAEQLLQKRDIVAQSVKHMAGIDPAIIRPTLASASTLNYRNKVQFPVAHPQGSKRILAGYYEHNSHKLVNVKHCPVQPQALDLVLEDLKSLLEKYFISAYSEKTHSGLLRHINLRTSFANGDILVTLVLNISPEKFDNSTYISRLKELAQELIDQHENVVGFSVNFNPNKGSKILGDQTITLLGAQYITETLRLERTDFPQAVREGIDFRLSPTSFFQVNSAQASKMLEVISDIVLKEVSTQTSRKASLIVDAYAGVGAIAAFMSEFADKVIAIEEYEQAVADGRVNMTLNNIDNVEFHCGKVEKLLPEILSSGVNGQSEEKLIPEVLIVDPPRKGVDPLVLNTIVDMQVKTIIYVSCNPVTLARDLKILAASGYIASEIQPLDMFPQTFHVESIATIRRGRDS